MDIVVPIITLLLGAVLGAWLNQFLTRPKLAVVGGGGGGGLGSGYYQWHLRIGNRPGFFGLRIRETILLGKRIHRDIEKGLSIDRNPANECSARLSDKKTGQHVASLWWRPTGRPNGFERRVSIRSGESFDLMLFARLDQEPLKYFIFEPEGDPPTPKVPTDELKFHDTREFMLQVDYSYGRQRLRRPVTVQRGFDGRLSVRSSSGGGSF